MGATDSAPSLLGRTGQRLLKAAHIASAGVWLGGLVGIVLLLAIGPENGEARARFGLDLAAYRLHEAVLFWAFIVTLVTGTLFSLVTQWGFFVHHWITAKWVLATALFALTLWFQGPAVSGVVALSDAGVAAVAGEEYQAFRRASLSLGGAQLGTVLLIYILSSLKPWGRRRPGRPLNRKVLVPTFAVLGIAGAAAGVAGYVQLDRFRNLVVEDVRVSALADGKYIGREDCGFEYVVEATVRGGRLESARAVSNRDVHYARIAEAVLPRIVAAQTARVDVITGASTTSRCLMRATSNALNAPAESSAAR